MKTFTRWLLALLLVAIPSMAVVNTASANTELVPGSRLVGPYVTLKSGQSTFIVLTNVSSLELRPGGGLINSNGGVHLEFYDKTCTRSSTTMQLSAKDVDQLNVSLTNAGALATSSEGFVDVDVRDSTVFTDALTAAGVRANALLGTVVISDTTNDFVLAYPMASMLGSSGNVHSSANQQNVIVTRGAAGAATGWNGRYEPLPNRLFLPMFFAEGSPVATTLLSVVTPPDGNAHGIGGLTNGGNAEAPGQNLAVPGGAPAGTAMMSIGALIFDGCEKSQNAPISGHTLMGALSTVFANNAAAVNRANWSAANCTNGVFPGLDELSGNPVGWIDLPNTTFHRNATLAPTQINATNFVRGMAGIFFESQTGAPAKVADVTRLWGNPFTSTSPGSICATAAAPSTPIVCSYTFAPTSTTVNVP